MVNATVSVCEYAATTGHTDSFRTSARKIRFHANHSIAWPDQRFPVDQRPPPVERRIQLPAPERRRPTVYAVSTAVPGRLQSNHKHPVLFFRVRGWRVLMNWPDY